MNDTIIKFYNDCKQNYQSYEGSIECSYFEPQSNTSFRYDLTAYGETFDASADNLIHHIDSMITCLSNQKQTITNQRQSIGRQLQNNNSVIVQ